MEWDRVKLAVGHCDLLSAIGFFSSMAYWQAGELVSKNWTVHLTESLNKPITLGEKATVCIQGDCLADLAAGDGALVHIFGDVAGNVSLKGQCEIVFGGSLRLEARIKTEGIVCVFVGNDLSGMIANTGLATIWVNGNCTGEVITGHPSTCLHVLGDFAGNIRPADKASLLSLDVRGFASNALLEQIAALEYTVFNGTIGSSDRPPGIYPGHDLYRKLRQKRSYNRWVVHSQADSPQREAVVSQGTQ